MPAFPLTIRPASERRGSGLLRAFAAGLALLAAALAPPPAAAVENTLLKLAETGLITIGANDDTLPLTYLHGNEHIGFHMDVCLRIVATLRQRFDLPQLRVMTIGTTQATRLAMLHNGTVDIACGHNPVTGPNSSQHRLFTHATVVMPMGAMVLAAGGPASLRHLEGKRVSTTVGGVALGRLRALQRNNGQRLTLVHGRTAPEMFDQLRNGLADVLLGPEPYLLAYRANSGDPARYRVLEDHLGSDALALMFRASDEALVELANEVIAGMMRNGEMERLYQKWFELPIPGLPAGLHWPLRPETRALFQDPGSEAKNF